MLHTKTEENQEMNKKKTENNATATYQRADWKSCIVFLLSFLFTHFFGTALGSKILCSVPSWIIEGKTQQECDVVSVSMPYRISCGHGDRKTSLFMFFFFVCIRSDFILLQWREQKKIPFMVFQIFVHSLGFAPPHFTVTTCAVDGALLGLNKNILWTLKIPWTQTHFVHKIQERKKSSKSWQRAHFHANST